MKVIARISKYYAKNEEGSDVEDYVIEDTPEAREELLDNEGFLFSAPKSDVEKFISGEENSLYIDTFGGDWDDPTGRAVSILTKEELIEKAKADYVAAMKFIEDKFS